MASVLITGAAGFVGSHLVDSHIQRGDQVIGVDNLATGSLQNIAHLSSNKQFTFINHDISQGVPSELPNVEKVYHFASPASPPRYLNLPLETMAVNTEGTRHLLEFSKSSGARILFASTSEVYGDPLVHPQVETYWGNVNPIGPRSVYDEAKRYGETLLALYQRMDWADTAIIRIFNTYGPRLDPEDGRVVSSFLRDALRGKPLPIFGNGTQTRSFCFVSDLVNGIMRMMDSGHHGPVNLGNPNEFTLLELAAIVGEVLQINPELEFFDLPQDDPKQRKPDISLAKSVLNWEPTVQLREGLVTTAAWMKEHIN